MGRKKSFFYHLFALALAGIVAGGRLTDIHIKTIDDFVSEAQQCTSSQECAEDRTCLMNVCQDPCLNLCTDGNLCQVHEHVASCHNKSITRNLFDSHTLQTTPTDNGLKWQYMYTVSFPFSIDGEQYFYGQSQNYDNWFIQRLLPNGLMGPETEHGEWSVFYRTQFPFSIDNRTFFYGQEYAVLDCRWFIQELLPGGKMGLQMDSGLWKSYYFVSIPFAIEGRQYFYGYRTYDSYWFIQELLAGGKMGKQTDGGYWSASYHDLFSLSSGKEFSYVRKRENHESNNRLSSWYTYTVTFPFSVQGEQFIYGQSLLWDNWFVQRLLPNGVMGPETDQGMWGQYYDVQFPFTIDNRTFFCGHSGLTGRWFVQELLSEGKMGEEVDSGYWKHFYHKCFPFSVLNRQFFYCNSYYYNNYWFIQELLPGGMMGKQTDAGNWNGVYNELNQISVTVV